MPEVDVVDATWFGVRPGVLAAVVADPANWRAWWPDLDLALDQLRGAKGVRWFVRSGRGRTVVGSMEIWLEPADDGTVAHFFLRLDGTRGPIRARERRRLEHAYRTRMKRAFWLLADEVDPGRLARVAGPPTRVP
jgi:hypothetical protein